MADDPEPAPDPPPDNPVLANLQRAVHWIEANTTLILCHPDDLGRVQQQVEELGLEGVRVILDRLAFLTPGNVLVMPPTDFARSVPFPTLVESEDAHPSPDPGSPPQ